MHPLSLFGPVDSLLAGGDHPPIVYVVFVLAVVNLLTRAVAHRSNAKRAAEEGADGIGLHPAHVVVTLLLVLGSFYLATIELHSGIVLSVLVVATLIADVFELESRRVEARNDLSIGRPNGAIAASVLVVLYAGYISLFYIVSPIWNAVI